MIDGRSDNASSDRRVRAVSAFLLDREPLFAALASRLGGRDAVFESAIRGSSMSPAIPTGARLRVRLLDEQSCQVGDVVFYLAEAGFMVHRVVHRQERGPAAGCMLTFGDHCLAPDPPVGRDRILGTVIAVQTAEGWRPPGPPKIRTAFHRFVRAATLRAMIMATRYSISAARRLAIVLQRLESATRPPAGRLLRCLHLTSSGR